MDMDPWMYMHAVHTVAPFLRAGSYSEGSFLAQLQLSNTAATAQLPSRYIALVASSGPDRQSLSFLALSIS